MPAINLQDLLFSLKTFLAAMLALWVALAFDMANPYWAVGTVYIVAHPLSGASTSKALYRLIGTVLGGAMTVILVPNLIDAPELLVLAISLWMAFCLGVSLLDRSPRSYAFMLAGYTTALTGFPIVAAPDTAFLYVLDRIQEIGLGILCAALVSRLVFPRHAGPVLSSRIDAWLKDGASLALGVLQSRGSKPMDRAIAQRLAADAVDLRGFTTHIAYDTSDLREKMRRTQLLQQRMVAMLPVVSGLADVIHAFERASADGLSPLASGALDAVSGILGSHEPLKEEERAHLLSLFAAVEAEAQKDSEWLHLLAINLTARLRDLAQIWNDCLTLQRDIASGSQQPLRWKRFGSSFDRPAIHRDYGQALHSGLSVILSTSVAAALWIFTAWPQGSAAAMMAGVLCCLFAAMDNPAPAMIRFLIVTAVAACAAFVFQFGLLPLLHGYLPLAAALGLALVPAGIMMARPSTAFFGLGFGVNFPNMLGLQQRLNLDLASFLNSNLALLSGLVIACGVTALVRSVGAEWTARRLIRSGWSDIVIAARRPAGTDIEALMHRMVDRLGLAAPRLAALGPQSSVSGSDLLKDLRNGLNTAELQRVKPVLASSTRAHVDTMLTALAGLYRQKARSEALPDAALLTAIDAAILALSEDGAGQDIDDARRAVTGLRYSLYPDADRPARPDPLGRTAQQKKGSKAA